MQTVTKGFIRNSLSCKELASHCKALQTVVVAQLDRAADCGSAGRTFKSCQPQHFLRFNFIGVQSNEQKIKS